MNCMGLSWLPLNSDAQMSIDTLRSQNESQSGVQLWLTVSRAVALQNAIE